MNATEEMLYAELRQTEIEIITSLQQKSQEEWLKTILIEELADIRNAIGKVKSGNFGQCEISGELFPEDLLKIMPTIKSKADYEKLDLFYRKSIH